MTERAEAGRRHQARKQEVLLRLVEVVVRLEGLQAVYQLLVCVLPQLQLVEVLVVVGDDLFYFLGVGLVDFGDAAQQVHYDLYVLDLFARLDFSIESETIVVREDRFWVFWHHDHSNLVLDELKIQLG